MPPDKKTLWGGKKREAIEREAQKKWEEAIQLRDEGDLVEHRIREASITIRELNAVEVRVLFEGRKSQ